MSCGYRMFPLIDPVERDAPSICGQGNQPQRLHYDRFALNHFRAFPMAVICPGTSQKLTPCSTSRPRGRRTLRSRT